jgi:hypothetical protein
MILTVNEQDHEVTLTQKEFDSIADMILFYKEFQEELYDYPSPETLFTETQRKLFTFFIPNEV